jgi:hypothetical protein
MIAGMVTRQRLIEKRKEKELRDEQKLDEMIEMTA